MASLAACPSCSLPRAATSSRHCGCSLSLLTFFRLRFLALQSGKIPKALERSQALWVLLTFFSFRFFALQSGKIPKALEELIMEEEEEKPDQEIQVGGWVGVQGLHGRTGTCSRQLKADQEIQVGCMQGG